MSNTQILAGFHAVNARIKLAPDSIKEIYFESNRKDSRMRTLLERATELKIKTYAVDSQRLDALAKGIKHQGVLAIASMQQLAVSIDDVLDVINEPALLLILDGVTDPHNLGACLRTADAAGVHAVIAPKDRSVGLNSTVQRVACGAADTVPYIMVTNLARTLRSLKERGIWIIGTTDATEKSVYDIDAKLPTAWVMGAEGDGMRRLTSESCDQLVRIPMLGSVESLNVSVASAVCLYESLRQRSI
ncbi:23S rRNA (guanosine(2251)-2'-O)-methyltransferase RlmB [Taylorella equigenitalis]|uniref:23S rRNA (guanosine-2'-O-)-methyltransferase RlmB n=1 Tax=Taylorella equigenitalis (strain MCE9) TaxID=937774 RepID=A0A654KIM8_TAYEM|nr:23S rRNA (guanosine(2251)-2'-O)-methyltransferase RlmB [Taylorella equigenitalis]ADU92272.1 23S rRNA (guanosine-2'-O-)-methyltransferase rlmB [Taylorella equigenitalis MCE9]ASY30466.1 23S rRNA (guanosine(2251)-2'-O)-methyltransferase RlmB [Taylorella equigenitalis]ASY40759.1 23S rRNA (guanosine(2251)-2'-O)-methyltransferase RlmB [Taylorella equigenitalis]KOS59102.1 23S rRNA methyltransferase [Taylorella equigenitalis]WDU48537.1 23S rRNA (guanosine(2251)-2'-O)-methyltransferase RlmB [Taylore